MVRRLSRFLDATLRPSITTPPTCGWPEAGSPCASAPVRTGPPWTVKFPEDSSGAVLRRREVTFDGPPDPVPAEAADLVRAYVRSRPLERAACLRTDRTPIEIRGRDGQRLAEVTDDRVTVHVGPGQRLRDAGTSVPRSLRHCRGTDRRRTARTQQPAFEVAEGLETGLGQHTAPLVLTRLPQADTRATAGEAHGATGAALTRAELSLVGGTVPAGPHNDRPAVNCSPRATRPRARSAEGQPGAAQ